MHYAVVKFCQFAAVPTVGGTYEVTGDTLERVDVMSVTNGAFGETFGCVLVAAVHTTVAVVVDRTVADVVLVHEVHDVHDSLRVLRSIAVDLDVEDMSAEGECVVRSLDLGASSGSTRARGWSWCNSRGR